MPNHDNGFVASYPTLDYPALPIGYYNPACPAKFNQFNISDDGKKRRIINPAKSVIDVVIQRAIERHRQESYYDPMISKLQLMRPIISFDAPTANGRTYPVDLFQFPYNVVSREFLRSLAYQLVRMIPDPPEITYASPPYALRMDKKSFYPKISDMRVTNV